MKYYHFKTKNGEIITIRSNSYANAEMRACNYNNIIEYLGWTETLESEIKK